MHAWWQEVSAEGGGQKNEDDSHKPAVKALLFNFAYVTMQIKRGPMIDWLWLPSWLFWPTGGNKEIRTWEIKAAKWTRATHTHSPTLCFLKYLRNLWSLLSERGVEDRFSALFIGFPALFIYLKIKLTAPSLMKRLSRCVWSPESYCLSGLRILDCVNVGCNATNNHQQQ